VQALAVLPGHADAVAAARAYLAKAQQKSGGYQGAAGVNSNSTGLAVQALLATDRLRPQQARDGQEFLRGVQNTDGGFRVTEAAGGSDVRSTTQAVPALAGTPLATLTRALGPITPAPGGGSPTATSSSGPGSATSASGSSGPHGGILAATGSSAFTVALLALLLAGSGAAALAAGRRRSPGRTGSHR
jgi:hypothetical protein